MSLPTVALMTLASVSPNGGAAPAAQVAIQLPDNCQIVALTPAQTGRAGNIYVCAPETSDGPDPVFGNNLDLDLPELRESVQFADLGDRWERPYIEALARQGILTADEAGNFNPDAPLTEAEFQAWLEQSVAARTEMQQIGGSQPVADSEAKDSDDASAGDASKDNAVQLPSFGKTLSGKASSPQPDAVVSRLETLVALAQSLELALTDEQKAQTSLDFADLDRVPAEAHDALRAVLANQILVPNDERSQLFPHFAATRADVAVLLYKSMVKGGGLAPIAIDSKGSIANVQIERTPSGAMVPLDSPIVNPDVIRRLFANPDSPGVIALGMAEGTRTVDGGKTSAYWGHTDPGNGKHNLGSFSYQHGARTPEEADFLQLQRLYQYTAALQEYAAANNMQLTLIELMAGIDLANQAPLAAQHYLANLQQLKARGFVGMDAILEARAYSYINPATGRLEASGFDNNWQWLRYDQARRIAAIQHALDYYSAR